MRQAHASCAKDFPIDAREHNLNMVRRFMTEEGLADDAYTMLENIEAQLAPPSGSSSSGAAPT